MALVIEDGSGLSNADSYLSAADARTYASNKGVTLDADDAVVEPQIRKAMAFLEGRYSRYQGEKATDDQALQWPRSWVWRYGYALDANTIPQELKDALAELVILIHGGLDIQPTITTGGRKDRVKVGPIDVSYDSDSQPRQPVFPTVEQLLRPLERSGNLTLHRR